MKLAIAAVATVCITVAGQDALPRLEKLLPPEPRIGFVLAEELDLGERMTDQDTELGDLDGDGDIDLLVVRRRFDRLGGDPDIGMPKVAVFWNDGDAVSGLFREGVFPPLTDRGWFADGIDLADMDGDGDDDVLTWGVGEDRRTGELRLYRSDGRRATRVDLGPKHGAVPDQVSGWIETPTGPNVLMLSGTDSNVIELRDHDGQARRLHHPEAAGWRFAAVESCAWADYDGDSHVDVASNPCVWEQGCLRLYRGAADGHLVDVSAEVLPWAVRQFEGNACAWVDLDDDRDLDLVAANYGNPFEGGDPEVLLRNDGAGGLTWVEDALGPEPRRRQIADLVVADFDLDGDPDLLFLGVVSTCSYIAENLGGFRFRCIDLCRQRDDLPWISGWSIDADDIDGDGDVDLVTEGRVYLNTVRP